MALINITEKIHRIHDEYEMDKVVVDTVTPNIFDFSDISKFYNLIGEKIKKKIEGLVCLGAVELISTSNNAKTNWYSHSINFESAGFILDIRRVIGTDLEVDLYFRPNNSNIGEMPLLLNQYADKELILEIKNNERLILEAVIYVDVLTKAAEGSGRLVPINQDNDLSGNISINIRIA